MTLTDDGADFLERIEVILADLDDAEQSLRGSSELKGRRRVGLGSSLAVREVIPRLPAFLASHGDLQVDLLVADDRQNLISEGIDIALRFGPIAGATATAKVIRSWPRVLAASPSYIEGAGSPSMPSDLSAHAIIVGPATVSPTWTLRRDELEETVRVNGCIRVTGNEGAIAAAVAGIGIVMSSSGSLHRGFADGKLRRILENWDLGTMDLSAVYASGRTAKRAARAFTDFLVETLPRP